MRSNSTVEILFEQILESIEATTQWSDRVESVVEIPQDVERHLLRTAELVRMLPETSRLRLETTNYRRIMAMRNAIVHSFLGRNVPGLMQMIRNDIPILKKQIGMQMSRT
ncbi:MAG: hypothetical protein F9K24_11845 [Leptonema illini]|jgi:uncharacterized protein with HEPN domain|uniref:DUF86 domain-containing protein n=2 Tax=Leptonema illini TaxID=183 RepID=H2CDT6_9LEPT|nr:HepT-like ribonuclease domain-containing protein [Leptonema illini]EHQ05455.1 hypothetical protein Lepil_0754 [Leptonema illini DSM 21528]KAB2931970.1 MAG: hypothetical protein F9K24_11845 [Leptonema illini]